MIDLPASLKARVDAVLLKLAMLSDAPTQRMSKAPTDRLKAEPGTWGYGGTNKQSFDGNMPPGVRDSRPSRKDPDRDPLIDWFVAELNECRELWEVEALVIEAEARHENRVNAASPRPHGFAGNPETTRMRDRRIVRNYRGLTPEQVAAVESVRAGYCDPESVRRVRFAGGTPGSRVEDRDDPCDPETGEPLPSERFMDKEQKKRWVREHVNAGGMSVREAARRVGVADSTALAWLGRRARRDRAA